MGPSLHAKRRETHLFKKIKKLHSTEKEQKRAIWSFLYHCKHKKLQCGNRSHVLLLHQAMKSCVNHWANSRREQVFKVMKLMNKIQKRRRYKVTTNKLAFIVRFVHLFIRKRRLKTYTFFQHFQAGQSRYLNKILW